jgi:hypothetical protein
MKKNLWEALAVLLFFGVLAYFFFKPEATKPPVATEKELRQAVAIQAALASAPAKAVTAIESNFPAANASEKVLPSATQTFVPAPAGARQLPEITTLEPLTVQENVRTAIRNYGQRFGGNPVGSNEEITRALSGENPRQVNYFNAEAGMRVNQKGELVDVWGVAFFFHQLSASQMEIRSAGPDKLMWTLDDIVTH